MSCVLLVLGAIWIGEHVLPPSYFQVTATLFVTGLASFLVWFSFTLQSIQKALTR